MKNKILKIEELDSVKGRGGLKENSISNKNILKRNELLKLKSNISSLEKHALKLVIKKI